MHRTALCLVVLAACAASAAELRHDAARDNPQRRDDALARFARGKHLTPIQPPIAGERDPYGRDAAIGTPIPGAGRGRLLALPAAGDAPAQVGFVETTCETGDSCGCDVGAEYRYYADGDRRIVVHLAPEIHVHTVTRSGSCGFGCGMQAPPPPSPVRALGPVAPSAVEVVDVPYRYDRVVETCDHPMPLP